MSNALEKTVWAPDFHILVTCGGDILEVYKQYDRANVEEKPSLFLLSPFRLAALAKKGHLSARTGFYALKVIMRLVCLRRDMGEELVVDANSTKISIGGEIPPIRVDTIELKYADEVQARRDRLYKRLAKSLKNASKNLDKAANDLQETGGTINMGSLRFMCHYAFSPMAGDFLFRVGRKASLAQNVSSPVKGEWWGMPQDND